MKNDYERFGEVIRYLTSEELSLFFDSIDNYKHKLMFQVIFELGCRVGEFVRIQVKHINFNRSEIFIPAENTKTKHARSSFQHKMGSFGKFASRGQLPAFECQIAKLIRFFPRKALKTTKKISGAKCQITEKRRYSEVTYSYFYFKEHRILHILRVWGFAVKSEIRNTSEIQNSNDPNEHISAAFVHSFTGFENAKLRIWRIGGKIILRVIESEGD